MSHIAFAPGVLDGQSLGKYRVLRKLAQGGMSEIYLAFLEGFAGFRKLIAIKSILPDIQNDEDFIRMFVDEARVTSELNHSNIAHVYDLDVFDGQLFLAMEFVPGCTLVEIARACRKAEESIPVGLTLSAVRDIARALQYAHTFITPMGELMPTIHRDVAEKNIMVTFGGTTKLLDFGIAKSSVRLSRTSAGLVKGTAGYMSPEQIRGEVLDGRSDIFSLGVVLHECLTGLRLFHGKSFEEGVNATMTQEIQRPSSINSLVPRKIDDVVMKALARRREQRFASAVDLAEALEEAGKSHFWNFERMGQFVSKHFQDRKNQLVHVLSEQKEVDINLTRMLRAQKILMPAPSGRSGEFSPEEQTDQATPRAHAEPPLLQKGSAREKPLSLSTLTPVSTRVRFVPEMPKGGLSDTTKIVVPEKELKVGELEEASPLPDEEEKLPWKRWFSKLIARVKVSS